jgi:DNA-binding transcriptional MerR regulator
MTNTYTIRETAEEMGITAHILRYYEKIGLLHPSDRGVNGHRIHTE